MKFLYKLGSYLIFIRKAFSRPEKRSVYTKEIIVEFEGNEIKVPKDKIKTANLEGEI